MSFISRFSSDTPTFFSRLRNIGLILTAVSVTLMTAGAGLPAVVTTMATYLGTAGAVAAAVSQAVKPVPDVAPVDPNDLKKDQKQ